MANLMVLFETTLKVALKPNVHKGRPRVPATYLMHVIGDLLMEGMPLYAMRRSDDPQPLLEAGSFLGELHLGLLLISGELHDTAHIAVGVVMASDEESDQEVAARIAQRMLSDFRRGCLKRMPEPVEDIVFGECTKLFSVGADPEEDP